MMKVHSTKQYHMLQNNICDYIFWDLNVLSPQK